jgi:hypothetical protein
VYNFCSKIDLNTKDIKIICILIAQACFFSIDGLPFACSLPRTMLPNLKLHGHNHS